ncbi:MAG: hypothetical protein JXA23_07585 [Bacteroidales bacterium]|nr:hypothetical protein [Bacteroidales bacterium]
MRLSLVVYFPAFFLLFPVILFPQDAATTLDKVYGLDQTLYNGKKYSYFLPQGTKGDQYFLSPQFIEGSVTLKGTCYEGVELNYDLFNQQLLLQYQEKSGAVKVIEVSKAWLSRFRIGSRHFELLDLGQGARFYQVLGDGPVKILYHWRKDLAQDATVGSSCYFFSSAVKESYLLKDGELQPFRTNKNLIKLFDRDKWPEIKSYLRKNKIKVRKASDQTMAKMINLISNPG